MKRISEKLSQAYNINEEMVKLQIARMPTADLVELTEAVNVNDWAKVEELLEFTGGVKDGWDTAASAFKAGAEGASADAANAKDTLNAFKRDVKQKFGFSDKKDGDGLMSKIGDLADKLGSAMSTGDSWGEKGGLPSLRDVAKLGGNRAGRKGRNNSFGNMSYDQLNKISKFDSKDIDTAIKNLEKGNVKESVINEAAKVFSGDHFDYRQMHDNAGEEWYLIEKSSNRIIKNVTACRYGKGWTIMVHSMDSGHAGSIAEHINREELEKRIKQMISDGSAILGDIVERGVKLIRNTKYAEYEKEGEESYDITFDGIKDLDFRAKSQNGKWIMQKDILGKWEPRTWTFDTQEELIDRYKSYRRIEALNENMNTGNVIPNAIVTRPNWGDQPLGQVVRSGNGIHAIEAIDDADTGDTWRHAHDGIYHADDANVIFLGMPDETEKEFSEGQQVKDTGANRIGTVKNKIAWEKNPSGKYSRTYSITFENGLTDVLPAYQLVSVANEGFFKKVKPNAANDNTGIAFVPLLKYLTAEEGRPRALGKRVGQIIRHRKHPNDPLGTITGFQKSDHHGYLVIAKPISQESALLAYDLGLKDDGDSTLLVPAGDVAIYPFSIATGQMHLAASVHNDSLNRLTELAGINETASAGSTVAGNVAAGTPMFGDWDSHNAMLKRLGIAPERNRKGGAVKHLKQ